MPSVYYRRYLRGCLSRKDVINKTETSPVGKKMYVSSGSEPWRVDKFFCVFCSGGYRLGTSFGKASFPAAVCPNSKSASAFCLRQLIPHISHGLQVKYISIKPSRQVYLCHLMHHDSQFSYLIIHRTFLLALHSAIASFVRICYFCPYNRTKHKEPVRTIINWNSCFL